MSYLDKICKSYFSDNFKFSDIFNFYLFNGNSVIKECDLKDKNIESISNINLEQYDSKFRDILKECVIKTDDKFNYLLLGIENQSKIDKEMVLRVLEYDIREYKKQYENNFKNNKSNVKINKKILPIITIVIYYGNDIWNAPRSLYDYFYNIDSNILKYIPNYKLNLICPKEINEEDLKNLNQILK